MNNLVNNINNFLQEIGISVEWADKVDAALTFLLVVSSIFFIQFISKRVIGTLLERVEPKIRSARVREIIFQKRVLSYLLNLIAPILLLVTIPITFDVENRTISLLLRLSEAYIWLVIARFLSLFMTAIYDFYSTKEELRDRPLKGLLQTAQTILYILIGIYIVSILIDKSAVKLLTGLGASAAILMLIFQDSILGVVSGIQLSANNMLKVGDWITVPKYGADGDVIEVTLNTVKVQNFDKTITTLPPYALMKDSFQNWRGMQEAGGRRVKRSINIDMSSVSFCTPEMLKKFKKIHLLEKYIEETETDIDSFNKKYDIDNNVLVNGRRQTNLGVFRNYVLNYLQMLPMVNKDYACMVRHLQPTEKGIPVELYFFTNTVVWAEYEKIQADVFDHLLAVIPEFGLRVFQEPSGADIKKMDVFQKE